MAVREQAAPVGPEPGCLADPCPACEPEPAILTGVVEPPVKVSDWEVAHELALLLSDPRRRLPWAPRIAVAFSEGGALGVVAVVRRELAAAKRRDLAGAEKTFRRGADL